MKQTHQRSLEIALEKTLWAYEKVISDPPRYIKKWESWGFPENCRPCKASAKILGVDIKDNYRCKVCPLKRCDLKPSHFKALMQHVDAIFFDNAKPNPEVFRKRYEWLIKKLNKSGYTYE